MPMTLTSYSADGLKRVLDIDTFTNCGLVINTTKTEIRCQPDLHYRTGDPTVSCKELKSRMHGLLQYLGSVLANRPTFLLDAEIEAKVNLAFMPSGGYESSFSPTEI